jgi:4-amino-4-deoxy-L-arabinose transferase-like glycosyltransferase
VDAAVARPLDVPIAAPRVPRLVPLALAALSAALFAIRLTGLPNLMDNEYRVGACVLDVLQHGNWLCPHDVLGNTDKPPMLSWLAALASWPLGRFTPFGLYLPTAVATFVVAWLVATAGGRHFGVRAGALGAVAYLLSDVGAHQIATARWDGIFTLTVTLAALAAFRAWTTSQGWTWFWLAAAAATLTKGPLGVLLAGLGLVAVPWERRSGDAHPLRGSHALGIALFLLLTVGWFLLAYRRVGPHLVQNMIGDEFVGNIVEHRVAYRFWKPPGDFLANFAPWSLLTLLGLYRVVAWPASEEDARRFERFLFCWFAGGLLLFCFSPHNQARLMFPMVPAAAMLAGRELGRLVGNLSTRAVVGLASLATIAALAIFTLQYHHLQRRQPGVRETLALEGLTRTVRATVGEEFPLTYVDDTPFAMQLLLDTMRPTASFEEAARLLRGETAAFVVVGALRRLQRVVGPETPLHEIARAADGATVYVHLVGNRERLSVVSPVATAVGPLVLRLNGARLGPTWDNRLVIAGARGAEALVENASARPQDVAVQIEGAETRTRTLAPDETWRIEVP